MNQYETFDQFINDHFLSDQVHLIIYIFFMSAMTNFTTNIEVILSFFGVKNVLMKL